jgi:hypothetical protein
MTALLAAAIELVAEGSSPMSGERTTPEEAGGARVEAARARLRGTRA